MKTPGRLPTVGHLSARRCLHLLHAQPGAGPASVAIYTWRDVASRNGPAQHGPRPSEDRAWHLLVERHDSSHHLPASEGINPQFKYQWDQPAVRASQLSFPRVLHKFPSATRNVTLGFTLQMHVKIKTCPRDLSWVKMKKLTVKKSSPPFFFFFFE